MYHRVLAMKSELPHLKKIVQIYGEVESTHPDVIRQKFMIQS